MFKKWILTTHRL